MVRWKDVVGYEGQYQVSDIGEVKNVRTGIVLKQRKHLGYCRVMLWDKQRKRNVTKHVHVLVAEAFCPRGGDVKMDACHINECRDDNRASNLAWMSHRDNCNMPLFIERQRAAQAGNRHAAGHPRYGSLNGAAKKVEQLTMDGAPIRIWDSIAEANGSLGIGKSCISNCCRGKSGSAGGYVWRYV